MVQEKFCGAIFPVYAAKHTCFNFLHIYLCGLRTFPIHNTAPLDVLAPPVHQDVLPSALTLAL